MFLNSSQPEVVSRSQSSFYSHLLKYLAPKYPESKSEYENLYLREQQLWTDTINGIQNGDYFHFDHFYGSSLEGKMDVTQLIASQLHMAQRGNFLYPESIRSLNNPSLPVTLLGLRYGFGEGERGCTWDEIQDGFVQEGIVIEKRDLISSAATTLLLLSSIAGVWNNFELPEEEVEEIQKLARTRVRKNVSADNVYPDLVVNMLGKMPVHEYLKVEGQDLMKSIAIVNRIDLQMGREWMDENTRVFVEYMEKQIDSNIPLRYGKRVRIVDANKREERKLHQDLRDGRTGIITLYENLGGADPDFLSELTRISNELAGLYSSATDPEWMERVKQYQTLEDFYLQAIGSDLGEKSLTKSLLEENSEIRGRFFERCVYYLSIDSEKDPKRLRKFVNLYFDSLFHKVPIPERTELWFISLRKTLFSRTVLTHGDIAEQMGFEVEEYDQAGKASIRITGPNNISVTDTLSRKFLDERITSLELNFPGAALNVLKEILKTEGINLNDRERSIAYISGLLSKYQSNRSGNEESKEKFDDFARHFYSKLKRRSSLEFSYKNFGENAVRYSDLRNKVLNIFYIEQSEIAKKYGFEFINPKDINEYRSFSIYHPAYGIIPTNFATSRLSQLVLDNGGSISSSILDMLSGYMNRLRQYGRYKSIQADAQAIMQQYNSELRSDEILILQTGMENETPIYRRVGPEVDRLIAMFRGIDLKACSDYKDAIDIWMKVNKGAIILPIIKALNKRGEFGFGTLNVEEIFQILAEKAVIPALLKYNPAFGTKAITYIVNSVTKKLLGARDFNTKDDFLPSLDEPLFNEGESNEVTWGESIVTETISIEEEVEMMEVSKVLNKYLKDRRSNLIVKLYFGFHYIPGVDPTFTNIGNYLGISRERARQLFEESMDILRYNKVSFEDFLGYS